MRQHRDRERRLRPGEQEVAAHRAGVASFREAVSAGDQPGENRQERGEGNRPEDERGPRDRRCGGQRPAQQQRQEGGGSRQGAPQVVHHLPAPDHGHPAAENPREELPVAARPSMLAGRRDAVVRRGALEQLHVGDEARPGEETLEEIVAQERVLGHPPGEGCFERVHVIDPLARV